MDRIKQFFSRIKRRGVFIFIVEDVRMRWHIVFFVLVVIAFGIAYMCFTPQGDGIGQNSTPLFEVYTFVTFLNGIYFSVITVSSLGYGDMHPMGISKALICIEVLLGLAMIGIMIAKVTSQSMSHQVSRLFSFDAQKRLEDIAAKFDAFYGEFEEIMTYQTPAENKSKSIPSFRGIINLFQLRCTALCDYFSDEMAQSNYFQIVPVDAVVEVGDAVDRTFFRLAQLITGLSGQARDEIFDGHTRQRISEAIDSQKKVCDLIQEHASDQNTLAIFERIKKTCENLPASYFEVPEEEEFQPDQVLQDTIEPQELSEVDNEHTDSP